MSDQAEAAAETKNETKPEDEGKADAPPADEMTPEEKKFLMLTLWDALIAPKWTKDTLIDFGKAIFSKKPLKDMSDKEFNLIFPFLRDATVELGKKLVQRRLEVEKENAELEKATAEAAAEAKAAEKTKTEPEDKK